MVFICRGKKRILDDVPQKKDSGLRSGVIRGRGKKQKSDAYSMNGAAATVDKGRRHQSINRTASIANKRIKKNNANQKPKQVERLKFKRKRRNKEEQ